VHIEVSLTVDVPATADVNVVEPQMVEAGRRAMREALRLAALRAQAQVARCPACAHSTLQPDARLHTRAVGADGAACAAAAAHAASVLRHVVASARAIQPMLALAPGAQTCLPGKACRKIDLLHSAHG
jgi:hypothetical protein